MMYRTLLKTIRKMLNSLTLRQQHFLYQRKNLYDQESSRSSSGEIVPENLHENLQPEFFISALYRTLSEIAALPRVKSGAAGRPRWAPLQYKMEDERQKYAGRGVAGYKHIGYGTLLSEISGRRALMCRGQEMFARLSL